MTEKRRLQIQCLVAGCVSLAALGWTVAVLASPARKAAKKPAADVGVLGQVLTEGGYGAINSRVGMKGHAPALLEREGRFSYAEAPAVYDLWVANQRGDAVAVYHGLTRRDPVIRFAHGSDSVHDNLPHRAALRGILRGDIPFPVESGYLVNVGYWADRTMAFVQLGHNLPYGGPRFGRWEMKWGGAPTLDGMLVALGQHGSKEKAWHEAFLASKAVSLVPGADVSVELKMTPVPVGHIAGVVDIMKMDVIRDIHFFYRLAKGGGRLGLANCHVVKTYDCPMPDVTALDGSYCATFYIYFPYGDATGQVTKCGGKLGMTDFSFHVGPPPKLKAPREGFAMTSESTLSWVDTEKGVYRFELTPDSRMPVKPSIEVFTAEKELRWPDLEGLDLRFPAGAKYRLRVSRLSGHASVDELVSGRDLGQDESQEVTSEPVEVTLTE
jgi:hypothetical protein